MNESVQVQMGHVLPLTQGTHSPAEVTDVRLVAAGNGLWGGIDLMLSDD